MMSANSVLYSSSSSVRSGMPVPVPPAALPVQGGYVYVVVLPVVPRDARLVFTLACSCGGVGAGAGAGLGVASSSVVVLVNAAPAGGRLSVEPATGRSPPPTVVVIALGVRVRVRVSSLIASLQPTPLIHPRALLFSLLSLMYRFLNPGPTHTPTPIPRLGAHHFIHPGSLVVARRRPSPNLRFWGGR